METKLQTDGYAICEAVLSSSEVENLRQVAAAIESQSVSRRENVFAIRNLLDEPEIQKLARSESIRTLVEPVLGPQFFATRGIFCR